MEQRGGETKIFERAGNLDQEVGALKRGGCNHLTNYEWYCNKWQQKVKHVKDHFTALCRKRNLFFIKHFQKLITLHHSNSKLHLNKKRSPILGDKFAKHIRDILCWQNKHCLISSSWENKSESKYANNLAFFVDDLGRIIMAHPKYKLNVKYVWCTSRKY